MSNKEILSFLPLTFNQLKHGFRQYIKNNYGVFYYDKRELNSENRRVITSAVVKKVKEFISHEASISVENIENYLSNSPDYYSISKSSIRRLLKFSLNAHYRTLPHISHEKNNEKTKIYRRLIAHHLVRYYHDDTMLISVDEASFASTHQKTRHWVLEDSEKSFRRGKTKCHKNLTLLVAI